MKLRLRGNSIRLRLTQPEVAALGAGRVVEERTEFPGGPLVVRLSASDSAVAPHASLADNRIEVLVPARMVQDWASSERIGIEHTQPLPHGESLTLLIEKDFACLSPGARESQAEAFPNPGVCRSLRKPA